jgi:hypothetical protein
LKQPDGDPPGGSLRPLHAQTPFWRGGQVPDQSALISLRALLGILTLTVAADARKSENSPLFEEFSR